VKQATSSRCPTAQRQPVPRFVQGVDVILACDGSGEGRGGPAQKDVLPPLVPGMKARQQQ